MTKTFSTFSLGYCTYIKATSPNTKNQSKLATKTVTIEIKKDINFLKMIKRGSIEDMIEFLQISNKLFNKKRRQINKSKQKADLQETSLIKATINSEDSFDKKELRVFIPAIKKLKSRIKNIDIAMIDANTYCAACYLKKTQVFAKFIRDIQYQVKKKVKFETNLKSIVSQEFHNFLDIFSKKNSDTLLLHQKYNYKIYSKEKQKPNHKLL